jgi:hypothetical protein
MTHCYCKRRFRVAAGTFESGSDRDWVLALWIQQLSDQLLLDLFGFWLTGTLNSLLGLNLHRLEP